MRHIHITSDGDVIGTVFLDHDGIVKDDGTPAAINAVHHMNHKGLKPEHGEKLLQSILKKLDRATLIGGHECNDPDCKLLHDAEEDPEDFWTSTEPSEVNNPDDHWPDWGEQNPAEKHQIPDTEHDYR